MYICSIIRYLGIFNVNNNKHAKRNTLFFAIFFKLLFRFLSDAGSKFYLRITLKRVHFCIDGKQINIFFLDSVVTRYFAGKRTPKECS